MLHSSSYRRFLTAAAAVLVASSTEHALADSSDHWDLTVGAGVMSVPEYPGGDTQKTLFLPVVSAKYGRFVAGGETQGLGFNVVENEHWRVAVLASFDLSKIRDETDEPRLRGLGDIDGTARVGALASYTWDWLTATARVSTDAGDNQLGTVASVGLSARWHPTSQLTLSAGPQVTWANGEYMQTVFGVDGIQSLRSGLPQYVVGSGVASVGLQLGANYRLGERWSIGVTATSARLQGDAKKSPITVDKTQNSIGVFAAYHF